MNKKTMAAYTVVALAFGAMGAWAGLHRAAPLTTSVPAGAASPAVAALFGQTLKDVGGKEQALAQWKGKTLVVNFWAPWCAPCVEEMPELSTLAADSAAKNIQVLGIGIDSPTNIAEFAAKFKIAYPLYVAGMSGTDLARQFGNAGGGLPFTVLIGPDGQVRKTYLGRLKFSALRTDLAALAP